MLIVFHRYQSINIYLNDIILVIEVSDVNVCVFKNFV